MMMAKQVIAMFGAPGSGKGTQAKNLMSEYGFTQVSTGELLRERVKISDALGKQLFEVMNAGGLVPDDLISQMLEEHLKQLDAEKLIFDGFPRNEAQSGVFDILLQKLGITDLTPIYLHVEEQELIRRLLNRATIEGRADDNKETITKRIQTYNEVTKPVVEHYRKNPNFVEVSGDDQPAEVVWEELKKKLNGKLN
ncbi:MAG: adenylate kinase [Candidatus Peribacteria bacterium]|jgi:adenylate kinase|nr:adenylate kinase [Candidatus Peribacteria bacterium]